MTTIQAFENAIKNQVKNLKEAGINRTAFWAYRHSISAKNELINFDDIVWEEDVEAIVTLFRENGIHEFTISSTFSSLITTLAAFDKLGCRMNGLTTVNGNYTDYTTNEPARLPAIKMVL